MRALSLSGFFFPSIFCVQQTHNFHSKTSICTDVYTIQFHYAINRVPKFRLYFDIKKKQFFGNLIDSKHDWTKWSESRLKMFCCK